MHEYASICAFIIVPYMVGNVDVATAGPIDINMFKLPTPMNGANAAVYKKYDNEMIPILIMLLVHLHMLYDCLQNECHNRRLQTLN